MKLLSSGSPVGLVEFFSAGVASKVKPVPFLMVNSEKKTCFVWIFFPPSHCPFYLLIKLFAFQSCLESWLQSELSHGRAVLGQSGKPAVLRHLELVETLQALLCACCCFWQVFTPASHSTSASASCSCMDGFGTSLGVAASFLFFFRGDPQGDCTAAPKGDGRAVFKAAKFAVCLRVSHDLQGEHVNKYHLCAEETGASLFFV